MKTSARVLTLAFAVIMQPAVFAQEKNVDLRAEEAAIRAIVNQPGPMPFTSDSIFWSGAYPRPQVGQEKVNPLDGEAREQRRNQKSEVQIVRLEVAAAGDMAYEFSNFTLSFDRVDTNRHVSFPGSSLRVWKKVDGKWQVVAAFLRPLDTPPNTSQAK